ncbi:MAG TPA: RloB family protein [Sphingomicrobium sp.]|nr:RloB family protein [Sphingomicrobium sp.]
MFETRRRGATRKPKERILLVCEGQKTERIYFSLFLGLLRAANVSLEIAKRDCGSDPLGIVRHAKALMKADTGIDHCCCVIDRDSHANFAQAVQEAEGYNKALKAGRTFRTIKSYPCFEFWFILHFVYSRSPFAPEGKKSAADCAVSKLKDYLPEYGKGNIAVIETLLDKTEFAIENAERAFKEAESSGEANPSTEVHILIKELKKHGL